MAEEATSLIIADRIPPHFLLRLILHLRLGLGFNDKPRVMIFSSEKARKHLLEKGFVFTFRAKRRPTGRAWITDKRGGKKICDAFVFEILKTDLIGLHHFTPFSGYDSWEEWVDDIFKLNRKRIYSGWLYYVETVEVES
ncbi:MAG: hypothetical protein DRO00_07810 [Thermoproteota archaeon]|nr:MAG: hypothetical protein DRO00_07810 [Candidatus Korarchaeota archaeon]